jgi:hypothetical protein
MHAEKTKGQKSSWATICSWDKHLTVKINHISFKELDATGEILK